MKGNLTMEASHTPEAAPASMPEESVPEKEPKQEIEAPKNDADDSSPQTTLDTDTDTQPGEDPPNISKNQLKRQQKWARAMEVKRRRKAQEKSVKQAKAEAEGRNIEAERKRMEEHRKEGSGRAKRVQKWNEKFDRDCSKFGICVDCSFENKMTEREINSLGSQLRFCYSHNKNAKHPLKATATSLSGETLKYLQNVSGFDQWATRAFEHTDQDIASAFPDKSKLVYLTSDSENVLETLEDGKTYIIGGIVDRNRLKRAAIDRAQELGIATAKLPIDAHLELVATKVLTVNHVFEILIRLREHSNDWKATLLSVLPERKDAKEKVQEVKEVHETSLA